MVLSSEGESESDELSNVNQSEARKGGLDTNKNPPSVLTDLDSWKMRGTYGLPTEINSCFYELPFKFGFRFAFPKFIQDVLNQFGLTLAQLMPNAWRVLLPLVVLGDRSKIHLSPDEFLY